MNRSKLEKLMRQSKAEVGTLASLLESEDEISNYNIVKVISAMLKYLDDNESFDHILQIQNYLLRN